MAYIGIDIGTFETKGVLVGSEGDILAVARSRHEISTPRAGHVEHDPVRDWWDGFTKVARELMSQSGGHEISGVGVSAIGPCVVATDGDFTPLRPAILYGVDTRASTQVRELTERLGESEIFARSGNYLTSQSAGPKIKWIHDEEPDIWAAARWFMTSQSWLVAKLTGEVTIDHATAGYFHPLYDLAEKRWNLSGCEDFITEDRLPRVDWTTTVAGFVHAAAAAETGLPEGVPVIVGTTDAPAEAVAAGVLSDGDLMAMYGSSGYFIRVGSKPLTDANLWAAPYVFRDTYVLAAGTSAIGTATRWICSILGITGPDDSTTFGRLIELADQSQPGARGVMVLPHHAGERTPFQDPDSRGAIVGLGLEHNQADLARALLEGTGHAVAEALLTYKRAGIDIERVVAIGGATRNKYIVETVCSITGLPQTVNDSPGASFGDAFLVAHALGGAGTDSKWWKPARTLDPSADPARLDAVRADHEAYLELYRALSPWNRERAANSSEGE